jgi:alpha-1,2-mannosyltransferase
MVKYFGYIVLATAWWAIVTKSARGWRPPVWLVILLGAITSGALLLMSRGTWFGDFDKAYYPAGGTIIDNPRALYECPQDIACFVNVPIVALLFTPLALFPPSIAHGIVSLLGLVAVAITIVLLASVTGGRNVWLGILAVVLMNGPMYYSLRLGNTTHFVLLVILAAFIFSEARRPVLGGICLAVAALVKPPLLLLGGYLLVRSLWKELAGFVAALCLSLAASLALFGAELHREFFERFVMGYGGNAPVLAYNVQSVAAALGRFTTRGHLTNWNPVEIGGWFVPLRMVASATLAATVAGVLAVAGRPRNGFEKLIELSLVMALALAIAPITWTHYYVLLLVPIAWLVGGGTRALHGHLWRLTAAVAVGLVSLPVLLEIPGGCILSAMMERVGLSHFFLGLLLLMAVLGHARLAARPAASIGLAARPPSHDKELTLALVLVALLATQLLVVPALQHVVFEIPLYDTTLGHVRRMLNREHGKDSWEPMELAAAMLGEPREQTVYENLFFRKREKFQYPLTALLFIGGLPRAVLERISFASVGAIGVLTALIYARRRDLRLRDLRRAPIAVQVLAVGLLASTAYPVVKAYTLGQIQTWMNAAAALVIWGWIARRRIVAGLVSGIMCLIKPTWVLLIGWMLIRRQRSAATAALAVATLGTTLAIVRFGINEVLDYIRVLSYIGQRGETFHPNQSFNGLLNRAFFNGSSMTWDPTSFAPYHPVVHIGTLACFVGLLALIAWTGRRHCPGGSLNLCAALIVLTITAPVAWEHHFGVLLPIYALCLGAAVRQLRLGHVVFWLMAASYLLVAQHLPVLLRFADGRFNVLQSYVLAGAIILLTAIWLLSRIEGRLSSATVLSPAA